METSERASEERGGGRKRQVRKKISHRAFARFLDSRSTCVSLKDAPPLPSIELNGFYGAHRYDAITRSLRRRRRVCARARALALVYAGFCCFSSVSRRQLHGPSTLHRCTVTKTNGSLALGEANARRCATGPGGLIPRVRDEILSSPLSYRGREKVD